MTHKKEIRSRPNTCYITEKKLCWRGNETREQQEETWSFIPGKNIWFFWLSLFYCTVAYLAILFFTDLEPAAARFPLILSASECPGHISGAEWNFRIKGRHYVPNLRRVWLRQLAPKNAANIENNWRPPKVTTEKSTQKIMNSPLFTNADCAVY